MIRLVWSHLSFALPHCSLPLYLPCLPLFPLILLILLHFFLSFSTNSIHLCTFLPVTYHFIPICLPLVPYFGCTPPISSLHSICSRLLSSIRSISSVYSSSFYPLLAYFSLDPLISISIPLYYPSPSSIPSLALFYEVLDISIANQLLCLSVVFVRP